MTLLARLTSPAGLSRMWHKAIYYAKEGKKESMIGYCCVVASKGCSMCCIVMVMVMETKGGRLSLEE